MGLGGIWEKKPKELFYAAGLLLAAFLAGILIAKAGRNWYRSNFDTVIGGYFNTIMTAELDYGGMFGYILWKNGKRLALFWMAQLTIFGIPLIAAYLAAAGFAGGFLSCALLMQYQGAGLLILAAYLLPQALLYIPAGLLCLKHGYRLASAVSGRGAGRGVTRLVITGGFLKPVGLSALLVLFGAATECFAGTFLLKKVLDILLT